MFILNAFLIGNHWSGEREGSWGGGVWVTVLKIKLYYQSSSLNTHNSNKGLLTYYRTTSEHNMMKCYKEEINKQYYQPSE